MSELARIRAVYDATKLRTEAQLLALDPFVEIHASQSGALHEEYAMIRVLAEQKVLDEAAAPRVA
jgi:hypothetical protein